MLEKLTIPLVVLVLANSWWISLPTKNSDPRSSSSTKQVEISPTNRSSLSSHPSTIDLPENGIRLKPTTNHPFILFAEAKGVAGLGKAGGDGSGGSDKAGQQVPPEVYNALTYAGSAFLLTLSVPLILYGLNKLLNRIEDCFGCGPSSRRKKRQEKAAAAAATQDTTNSIDQQQQQLLHHQQLENQKLHQKLQQQSYKLPAQSLLNAVNSNLATNGNLSQFIDQQPVQALPDGSVALTLPFASEPHYKTPTSIHTNFQQSFVVSNTHH